MRNGGERETGRVRKGLGLALCYTFHVGIISPPGHPHFNPVLHPGFPRLSSARYRVKSNDVRPFCFVVGCRLLSPFPPFLFRSPQYPFTVNLRVHQTAAGLLLLLLPVHQTYAFAPTRIGLTCPQHNKRIAAPSLPELIPLSSTHGDRGM
jgi:hypothetical protein